MSDRSSRDLARQPGRRTWHAAHNLTHTARAHQEHPGAKHGSRHGSRHGARNKRETTAASRTRANEPTTHKRRACDALRALRLARQLLAGQEVANLIG